MVTQAQDRAASARKFLEDFLAKFPLQTCGDLREFMINRAGDWFVHLHADVRKEVWTNLWLKKGASTLACSLGLVGRFRFYVRGLCCTIGEA